MQKVYNDKKIGKKSLLEQANAQTMFIIDQLIKVDSKGNRKENYLGFEEKAETGKNI